MNSGNIAIRQAHPLPCPDDVRDELERILSSPHLEASDRRRAFLRYIVEETLAGRANRLKGFTVALAVFGRDETFDSQSDPVVRLEARRLRRDLDSYYVEAGSHDPVRITIPKGSYVPHFEWHEPSVSHQIEPDRRHEAGDHPPAANTDAAHGADTRSRWSPLSAVQIAGVLVVLIALGAAGWLFARGRDVTSPAVQTGGPAVVVLPFRPLSSSDESRYLAEGIAMELTADLMRFPGFRLYAPSGALSHDQTKQPANLGRDLGVAYVVEGSVREDAEEVRVAAQLYNAETGQVLWTGIYDRPRTPEALIKVQSDLAAEIATELGQPYGVVNTDLGSRITSPAVSSMQSYICVLRAYGYRRTFSRDEFEPVLRCLEEAVRRDPDYSDAWAMLGWLHLDAGRYEFVDKESVEDAYEEGLQAATRAEALAPNSTLALKALSSIHHYLGNYDEAEALARRAVELNPNDPDTLAQLGWRLAVRGKFDEGIPILRHAIERTANPPGWYFHLIAIDCYLKGDYEQMLQVAERSGVDGSGFSHTLVAIAAGALGDRELTRQALARTPNTGPLSRSTTEFLRRHGATDEIVDRLVEGVEKARAIAAQA